MKIIFLSLFLLISMISAQAAELINPCLENCQTESSQAQDHDGDHCHDRCVQCHIQFVLPESSQLKFVSISYLLNFQFTHRSIQHFPLSFERPPSNFIA